MYVLLPPSEGKSSALGSASFRHGRPEFVRDVEGVLTYLASLSARERLALYGLKSEEKAREAHAWNLSALDTPAVPALERYTGVVYDHLDFGTLPNRAAARKRLLIVSALFGLIPGATPLPCYKLSMTPWLTRYWRPRNSARLEAIAQGKPVLNLLSQNYARALEYPSLITVDFRVGGGQKAAGHFGKAIKGRFVRWLLENNVKRVQDFGDFREEGYQFDGENFVQAVRPAGRA